MSSSHPIGKSEPAPWPARLALGLILALGLTACGTQSNAAEPEMPTALPPTVDDSAGPATASATEAVDACDAAAWSLEFEVSGGLMGIHRSLKVDSGGQAMAVDVRKGTQATSKLADETIEQIRAMLRALCPFESAGRPAPCADCFEYTLAIHWGDQSVRLNATDVTLVEQRLEPLAGELNALMGEILGDGK